MVALIDQIKSESEGLTLMRHGIIEEKSKLRGLEFVDLAIEHTHKKVVVESEVQYFVEEKVKVQYVFCDFLTSSFS